jgi:hypothetical protein
VAVEGIGELDLAWLVDLVLALDQEAEGEAVVGEMQIVIDAVHLLFEATGTVIVQKGTVHAVVEEDVEDVVDIHAVVEVAQGEGVVPVRAIVLDQEADLVVDPLLFLVLVPARETGRGNERGIGVGVGRGIGVGVLW